MQNGHGKNSIASLCIAKLLESHKTAVPPSRGNGEQRAPPEKLLPAPEANAEHPFPAPPGRDQCRPGNLGQCQALHHALQHAGLRLPTHKTCCPHPACASLSPEGLGKVKHELQGSAGQPGWAVTPPLNLNLDAAWAEHQKPPCFHMVSGFFCEQFSWFSVWGRCGGKETDAALSQCESKHLSLHAEWEEKPFRGPR